MIRSTPLRRKSMPIGARQVPLTRTGRLAARSPKRRRQEVEYSRLRREFLAAHPWCAFPGGCGAVADTVQHLRGRRGERLLDVKWWAPSCLAHNLWAEDHTGEALEMGWLVRIEGVA